MKNVSTITALIAGVAAVAVSADPAFAGGGTPIQDAAQAGLDIAVGLGVAGATAGVIVAAAGGMMRNNAIVAGGATAAVCGGGWAGAPDVVTTVLGGAAGITIYAVDAIPTSVIPTLLSLVGLA